MSDGQPTKPNWAEKTGAVSNVLQNIQLQELHSTMRATGALQVETLQRAMNERQEAEREDRLRENLWQMEQGLDRILNNPEVALCTRFILSKQVQDLLKRFGVTTASFRQFADKDRVGRFMQRLELAMRDANEQISAGQKTDMDTYLRYVSEAQELDALVTGLQNEDEQKQKQLASTKARKEQSLRQLEALRQQAAKSEQKVEAPRSGQKRTLTTIAMVATIILAPPIGLAWLTWRYVRSKLSAEKPIPEQIAALQSKIDKDDRKITELQLWIDTPWEPEIFAEFQAKDLPDLLQCKKEREEFMRQFCQTNSLPLDGAFQNGFQGQSAGTIGQASPRDLSPEVQELARHADKKISAIVLHRQQTGVSLAEAKAAVEAFNR